MATNNNSRTTIILSALRCQPESAYALAARVRKETKAATFVPTASIRRDIGTLRTQGHAIENVRGLYKLTVPPATTMVGGW